MRDAGCEIVRSAHYPQDPTFMDACDELGMFVIIGYTPVGNIGTKILNLHGFMRILVQMIRRDRNHPSVLVWEPILNETRFPIDFSLSALQVTKEEYPYPGAPVAAGDLHSAGIAEHYGLVYGWPDDEGKVEQCIFTREFGENVDDWYAHNANNRASRNWGEHPQLVQALSLAQSYGNMFRTTGHCWWAHWHPLTINAIIPIRIGVEYMIVSVAKYAFYMFKSQVDAKLFIPWQVWVRWFILHTKLHLFPIKYCCFY